MAGIWKKVEGGIQCSRHGEIFKVGKSCSACAATPEKVVAVPFARRVGIATVEDHERWFVQTSEDCRMAAEGADPTVAVRYIAEAVKARKNALDIAVRRENENKLEEIERKLDQLMQLRSGEPCSQN